MLAVFAWLPVVRRIDIPFVLSRGTAESLDAAVSRALLPCSRVNPRGPVVVPTNGDPYTLVNFISQPSKQGGTHICVALDIIFQSKPRQASLSFGSTQLCS